jgi:hypothetical protein
MQAINNELPSCNHRDNANRPATDVPPQHSQDIGRACSVKHHMGRCQTLLRGRERFHEQSSYALLHKQIEGLRSSDPSDPFRQGLQLSRSVFHLVGVDVGLDHSSSCAAARLGLVRGSMGGNNLPLSEKMRSIFRTRCMLRTGPCSIKSRSNLESFEIVRISVGSVTTTMSVIPGKYVRFM